MVNEAPASLSPTVLQVIDEFIARMRADDGIEADAINRLEKLLRKTAVPKAEESMQPFSNRPQDGEA